MPPQFRPTAIVPRIGRLLPVFSWRGRQMASLPFRLLKRAVLATFAAVLVCASPASAATVTTPSPGGLYADGHTNRYLLDGPWWFKLDPRGVGVRAGYAHSSA